MAYLTKSDFNTAMYTHIIDEIADFDDSAVAQCIAVGIEQVKSYLKNRYDTAAIFSAEGDDRNPLILEYCKVVAVWELLKLCSAETLYEFWQQRYDRVIEWLEGVRDGKNTPDLPLLTRDIDGDGNPDTLISMRYGSNPKFNHYI